MCIYIYIYAYISISFYVYTHVCEQMSFVFKHIQIFVISSMNVRVHISMDARPICFLHSHGISHTSLISS